MSIEDTICSIVVDVDRDDATGCGNGHHRIFDDRQIVVYENFMKPSSDWNQVNWSEVDASVKTILSRV